MTQTHYLVMQKTHPISNGTGPHEDGNPDKV